MDLKGANRMSGAQSGLLYTLIIVLMLFTACNEPFDPLAENDQYHFSFYGYLDASVDTQWVRITPLRDSLKMAPVVPEMTVTIEDLATGSTATMNDSLFQNDNGFNYLNFWTTMEIHPEHTYRMVAELPEGATSNVTVTTPPDSPELTLRYTPLEFGMPRGCGALIYASDIDHLADIQSIWKLNISSGQGTREDVYRFTYRDDAYGDEELYTAKLNAQSERDRIVDATNNDYAISDRYIFVASAGHDWVPGLDSLDNATYTLPAALSNVENGLGYVVGIVSDTVHYERCLYP